MNDSRRTDFNCYRSETFGDERIRAMVLHDAAKTLLRAMEEDGIQAFGSGLHLGLRTLHAIDAMRLALIDSDAFERAYAAEVKAAVKAASDGAGS